MKKFNEEQYNLSLNSINNRIRFYAAQIVLAIQALHEKNIIYREYLFINYHNF